MGSPYTSRVSLLEDSPRHRDRDPHQGAPGGRNGLHRLAHAQQLRLWGMDSVATFVRLHGEELLHKFLSVSHVTCYP